MTLLKLFSRRNSNSQGRPQSKAVLGPYNAQIIFTKDSNPMLLSARDIRNVALDAVKDWESLSEPERTEIHNWLDDAINEEYLDTFVAEINDPKNSREVRRQLSHTYVLAKWALDDLQVEQKRVETKENKALQRKAMKQKWHRQVEQLNDSTRRAMELAGLR